MVSKTWMIAGLAVVALVGVGFAVAQGNVTTNDSASANASAPPAPVHKDKRACDRDGKDGDKCRGLAAYKETNGSVSGRNVAFTVDAQTGEITNYESRGPWGDAVIFDSIAFVSYNASDAKEGVHGPVYMLRDAPDVAFLSFDARNAAFAIWSKSGETVRLTVPSTTTVQTFAKQPGWSPAGALLTNGNHTAKLVLRGDATVSAANGTITVTLGPHSGMFFRIVGYPGETAKEMHFLKQARDHRAERAAKGKAKAAKPSS